MNIEDTLRQHIAQLELSNRQLNERLSESLGREINANERERAALRKLDEVKRDLASRAPSALQIRIAELEAELRKALEKEETKTFEPHDLKPATDKKKK